MKHIESDLNITVRGMNSRKDVIIYGQIDAPFQLFAQWIVEQLIESPTADISEFSTIKRPVGVEVLLVNSDHYAPSPICSNEWRKENTNACRIVWSNDTEAWLEVSEKITAVSESPYPGYNFLTEDTVNDVCFYVSRGQRESLS